MRLIALTVLFLFLCSSVVASPHSSGNVVMVVESLNGDIVMEFDYLDAERIKEIEMLLNSNRAWVAFYTTGDGKRLMEEDSIELIELSKMASEIIHHDGTLDNTHVQLRWARLAKHIDEINEEIIKSQEKIIMLEKELSEESAKPVKPDGNLKFTTKVTDLDSGKIVQVESNGHAIIKSSSGDITVEADTEVMILPNDDGDYKTTVSLGEGSVNINTKGGSVVMITKSKQAIIAEHTDYDVIRRGNTSEVSVHEGEVNILTQYNGTFFMIFVEEGQSIRLDDNIRPSVDSYASSEKPFEILSISPKNVIFKAKPVIEVVFNIPVNPESVSPDSVKLMRGDIQIPGIISLYPAKKLVFIPNKPLGSGDYEIELDEGLKSLYNTSLSEVVKTNFTVYNHPVGTELRQLFSKPIAFNLTETKMVSNTGLNAATNIEIQMPLTPNSSNVFVRINSITPTPASIRADSEGNSIATWEISRLAPGEIKNITVSYTGLSFSSDFFSVIDPSLVGEYDYSSREYLFYTRPDYEIQSENKEIVQLSSKLTEEVDNPYIKAQKQFSWISSNILYDYSFRQSGGAIETLRAGEGVCQGYATLFSALLRSQKVPAKYVSGWLFDYTNKTQTEGHAWVDVLMPGFGWIPSDPTGGRISYDYFMGIDAYHIPVAKTRSGKGLDHFRYSGRTNLDVNHSAEFKPIPTEELDSEFLQKLYYAIKASESPHLMGLYENDVCTSDSQLLIQRSLEEEEGGKSLKLLDNACRESVSCFIQTVNQSLQAIKGREYGMESVRFFNRSASDGGSTFRSNGSIKFSFLVSGGDLVDSGDRIKNIEADLQELSGYEGDCKKAGEKIRKMHDDVQYISRMSTMAGFEDLIGSDIIRMNNRTVVDYSFNFSLNDKQKHIEDVDFTTTLLSAIIGFSLVGLTGLMFMILVIIWFVSIFDCLLRKDLRWAEKAKWAAIITFLSIIGTLTYLIMTRLRK